MLIAERLYCQWVLTKSDYPLDKDEIMRSSDKRIQVYLFQNSVEEIKWLYVFEDESVLMNTISYRDNGGFGFTRWFENIIKARELLYSEYPKITFVQVLNGPEQKEKRNDESES